MQLRIRLFVIVVGKIELFNRNIEDFSDLAYTNYWTGFLNNTYSGYCTPKISYGTTSFNCTTTYQCQDYNYVTCISGQCTCSIYQYWDGTLCEPRLNYSYGFQTPSTSLIESFLLDIHVIPLACVVIGQVALIFSV